MGRRLLIPLVGIALGAIVFWDVRAAIDSRSTLSGQALVDLGTLDPGARVSTVVPLRNEGWNQIRISGVHVSCGCLSATVKPDVVGAGESANLSLDLNALGGGARKIGVEVLVHSTAANSPHALKLIYDLRSDSPLSARQVYFGTVDRDALPTSRNVICHIETERSPTTPTASRPSCALPFVTAEFAETQAEEELPLTVTITPEAPCGEILTDIRIPDTSDGVSREHALKVSALVPGKVSANPPMLWLRDGEEGRVTIKAHDAVKSISIISWDFYPEAEKSVVVKKLNTDDSSATLVVTAGGGQAATGKWLAGTIIASVAQGESNEPWEWISIPVLMKN